jgi:hypothetical protein
VKIVAERSCKTVTEEQFQFCGKSMSLRGKFGVLCSVCLGTLTAMSGFAQTQTTERLAGTVRDVLSQVIPQAEVLAKVAATGARRRTLTNELGDCTVPLENLDLCEKMGLWELCFFIVLSPDADFS